MKDLSVDKLSVPNVSVVQKEVLLYIFPGSGANYQGTMKVIFNQWPRDVQTAESSKVISKKFGVKEMMGNLISVVHQLITTEKNSNVSTMVECNSYKVNLHTIPLSFNWIKGKGCHILNVSSYIKKIARGPNCDSTVY